MASWSPKSISSIPFLMFVMTAFEFSCCAHSSTKTQASLIITEQVLSLFSLDVIHNFNFVLYGGNVTGSTVAEYIGQNPKYDNISIIIAHISGINERFENVLLSCLQNEQTGNILIIQPSCKDQAEQILSKISWLYERHPARSSTIHFFISWPWTEDKDNISPSRTSSPEILHVLKTSVMNAPLDGHLYILIPHLPEAPAEPDNKQESQWIVWEFYHLNEKYYVFEPVPISNGKLLEIIQRRKDFKGATLRGIAQDDDLFPFVAVYEGVNQSRVFKGGKACGFFGPVSKSLNFSLEIIPGTGWISDDSNGSLTGMGKQLLNREAEFTATFSEMLGFRLKHLVASHPASTYKVKAYYRQPPPGLFRDIFVQAFSFELWLVMGATWGLIITCIIGFSFLKRRYCQNEFEYSEPDQMIGQEAVSWALGIACQQGWHYTPTSASLQIILICGLLASLLYYTAFSASIISIFSVEVNSFDSLSKLIKYGFTLYGNVESLSGQHSVKEQAKEDGVSFESRIVNATVALDKIKNSLAAHISSQELFFALAAQQQNSPQDFCKYLKATTRVVDMQYVVIFFKKFSAFKKFIDLQLTRWLETGLLHHWNLEYSSMLPEACEPKRKEPLALEFQDVRTAFLILMLGFILCICVLIYEVICCSRRNLVRENNKLSKLTQDSTENPTVGTDCEDQEK